MIHVVADWKGQFIGFYLLTTRCRDKMTAISQTTFSNQLSCMKIVVLWLEFHNNFYPRNNPALVLMMAYQWIGDKPLSEQMTAYFNDEYMLQSAQWLNSSLNAAIHNKSFVISVLEMYSKLSTAGKAISKIGKSIYDYMRYFCLKCSTKYWWQLTTRWNV